MAHTEKDLDVLIDDELDKCEYKNICLFRQTAEGARRIKERVKEIIFSDGITDVESALAKVDEQLEEEKLQSENNN